MGRLDVKDHITPIWDKETSVPSNKDIDVDDVLFTYSYSLQRFITRSISDITISSFESSEPCQFTVPDIEESQNRGVFLHDVCTAHLCHEPLHDSLYHIFIRGKPEYGELLECVDASPLSLQHGIILYEWFIGIDYNSTTRFSPAPISTGNTFSVPLEAIGKYIFCRAHRRVEAQAKGFEWNDVNETFDPHLESSKKCEYNNIKRINDVSTMSSIGPIHISNDMALEVLEYLTNSNYRIEAILCFNKDFSRNISYNSTETLCSTMSVIMGINITRVFIEYDSKKESSDCCYKNFVYLSKKLDGNGLRVEFDVDILSVEESPISEKELLIGVFKDEMNYISLRFNERILATTAYYTLSSLVAQKTRSLPPKIWEDSLKKADLDAIKEIIMEHLSTP